MIKMSDNPELIAKWKAIWKDRCTSSMSTADHAVHMGLQRALTQMGALLPGDGTSARSEEKEERGLLPGSAQRAKRCEVKINGIAMEFSEDLNEDALNKSSVHAGDYDQIR